MMKFVKTELNEGAQKDLDCLDLQAGSGAMSIQETVSHYLKTPGQVLTIVRKGLALDLAAVATAAKIKSITLEAYESGKESPSLKHLMDLADVLHVNGRFLLEAFGHVAPGASRQPMGIAAMSSEILSDEEKAHVRQLIRNAASRPTTR